MRFRAVTRLFLAWIVALSFVAGDLLASDEIAVPDPIEWLKDVVGKNLVKNEFPFSVVFISTLPKGKDNKVSSFEFLDLSPQENKQTTFFQIVDPRTVSWNFKLNPHIAKTKEPLEAVLLLADAQLAVQASPEGGWRVLHTEDGKQRVLARAAGPKSPYRGDQLVAWVMQQLNWDGVVLARKGEFLLVGSTSAILNTPNLQALTVEKSHDKLLLPKQRKGSGLLSLSKYAGGIGVFNIIFLGQDTADVPAGTKLIIERKN